MKNCIFCKIIAQQIPSQVIAQTENLLVIKDIVPQAPVHYLIMPKKHIANLMEISLVDIKLASDIFLMAQNLAQNLPGNGDFRLTTNNGLSAGQSVFHLHFHFLAGF